ncbi:MAG: rRNA maturation RNase YbeY [Terrimonas sp.]|nr:rRNA maturation RNase YbeY [Terrimonas sp.]
MLQTKSADIHFFSQGVRLYLRNRRALKSFLQELFKKEGKKLESLNYIFCTDEALLSINKTYLKHDYYTDIISFDLSDKGLPVKGEIYISLDRVKANAKSFRTTIKEEIHRVIFHGALHLCGYKDKTSAEINEIRSRECFYLKKYGISCST